MPKKRPYLDTFIDVRVDRLCTQLSPENAAKLRAMSREKQERIVTHFIKKGLII